jgi:hypothetical protein
LNAEISIPVCREGQTTRKRDLRGCFADELDSFVFFFDDLKNSSEAGNFQQASNTFRRIQNGHEAALIPYGSPDRDQLTQSRTVDVINTAYVQNEVSLTFTE